MAGTYLGDNDWVVSDENGDATLVNDGEGTGAGPDEIDDINKKIVDTDADSWDSGSNEPDFPDDAEYSGLDDIEPLDDEEIDDRNFDCD